MNGIPQYQIEPFGERGWLAEFTGVKNDIEGGLFANKVAKILRSIPGITDAVAGINSISIRFSPSLISAESAHDHLCNQIESPTSSLDIPGPLDSSSNTIDIPVLYGGEAGPDLDVLCDQNNLSRDEVITIHSAKVYRVITLGFSPGFAYLGPLDERLIIARLATPRPHLPAGSIGVAGNFTSIYSLPSPGGWNILGRTPLKLFDAEASSPFLFEAGAEVRFRSINQAEFNNIQQQNI